jgi:hypothetical protein
MIIFGSKVMKVLIFENNYPFLYLAQSILTSTRLIIDFIYYFYYPSLVGSVNITFNLAPRSYLVFVRSFSVVQE